jgi:hypothetical protein
MTKGQDLRIATLNDARSRRSAEKRGAVEDAIMRLRDTRQAVTFVSVAREAKVSRQYLYNNFADEISEERVETRAETEMIDGKKVPLRTPEEYRQKSHYRKRAPERRKLIGPLSASAAKRSIGGNSTLPH